jgi:ABC-type multidrug transport system ATPase subunit
MTREEAVSARPLAAFEAVTKHFGSGGPPALASLSGRIGPGQVTGLVGPDGAGKTTLMRLLAGLLLPDVGQIDVCGYDTRRELTAIRRVVSYMPQRFGLYEDLTVIENLNLYADLRAVTGQERQRAFDRLLSFTGLESFTGRLAGKLSGGMKQKLGLACALVKRPELLLLDEPSVGVDPISRRELWKMVYQLVDEGIGVVWSTAYLDEAQRCSDVLLLDRGRALYAGPPDELTARVLGRTFLIQGAGSSRRQVLAKMLNRPDVVDAIIQGNSIRLVMRQGVSPPDPASLGSGNLRQVPVAPRFEDAYIDLLGGGPKGASPLAGPAYPGKHEQTVVEAVGLTKTFGSFTAVDHISFRIGRGEVFGLLGPNGAGKSTTFKMMCGLLRPTSGLARVASIDLYRSSSSARSRLGYMAQKFSLYGDLSVRQNLEFFAGIYGLRRRARRAAIDRMAGSFGLTEFLSSSSGLLPLGFKQRLALACAVMHEPEVLFLDEPTSGVDPVTRREFWSHINALVERGVTVMVTTHFLDEAEYCDRLGLVYKGRVIATGSPDELKDQARSQTVPDPSLEETFIALIEGYDRAQEATDHAA